MFSEKNVKNATLNINYINNLAKKLTRFILASLIVMLAFISCEDASNILVTEKEAKTSNGRFELSLKIDPDIVYSNSSTKLITSIRRSVHKDSLGSNEPIMKVSMGAIGGTLDQHAEVYSYTYNGVIYYENEIVSVNIADSINAVWEGLAFFLPSLPLKDSGHISAVFDGMNLTLPIKLVATPE